MPRALLDCTGSCPDWSLPKELETKDYGERVLPNTELDFSPPLLLKPDKG